MFHTQRRAVSRIATVMLASGMAVTGGLMAAGAAFADGGAGITATLQPTLLSGSVDTGGGHVIQGGLFTLKTDDGKYIQTYCIDIDHGVKIKDSVKYQESNWASSSLGAPGKAEAAGKIRWILEHSYPKLSLDAVKTAVGITGEFTKEDAAAGTQAAIWRYSDNKTAATPLDAEAKQLTEYLAGSKNTGLPSEPAPSLDLDPAEVAGKSGTKLGPFTLSSSADLVKLSLTGDSSGGKVKLLDKDGKAVTDLKGPIAKNTQLFLDVPAGTAAGSASVKASATVTVPTGRVFLSVGYTPSKHSQTMILAGSEELSVSKTAKATWTQAKGPLLATSAKVDCTANGVRVSVTNSGDQQATVTVTPGKSITVPAGKTETLLVPVAEDATYDIKVSGPGLTEEFKGILDCKTSSTTGGGSGTPTPTPTPSTGTTTGGSLATTGGGSETPVIAGVAGALVVAGGAAVFALRRRGRHGRTSA
ncbi:TQXA domain-containing protein [Kitasatospora sp. NE20-6]